jgi:hypothetical protein
MAEHVVSLVVTEQLAKKVWPGASPTILRAAANGIININAERFCFQEAKSMDVATWMSGRIVRARRAPKYPYDGSQGFYPRTQPMKRHLTVVCPSS